MKIQEFNFSDLCYYLKNFNMEVLREFEEKNPFADSLENYFLGAPAEYNIPWDNYYNENDKTNYSQEDIIKLEKEKLKEQYAKYYPGIKFNIDYEDWEEKIFVYPKNQKNYLLYKRTTNYGNKMLESFREKSINEALLIKSINDKSIPAMERNQLIPFLIKRKVKNLNKHLENIALNDESTECRHTALGGLYYSTKEISEKTLNCLLKDFPKFTLSKNLSFSLSILTFGCLKKIKNLDSKFIDILEICKNNLSNRMENQLERADLKNPYLYDKDKELFSDCLKVFMTHNPNDALDYLKILIKDKDIGGLVNKTTKKFFEQCSLEEKRRYAKYLIKQNFYQIQYIVKNSENQIEKKNHLHFPKEKLKEKILDEHEYIKIILNLRNPVLNINHLYSEVKEEFVKNLEKCNAEFMDHLRNRKKKAGNKYYFNKVNQLIKGYVKSQPDIF